MRIRHLVLFVLVGLIAYLTLLVVRPTQAAGTVGTGTAESCTEAALDAALVGGGAVTFNCGKSPAVISIANEKVIEQNVTLDGGGLITLSGRNVTRLFKVAPGATFEVRKLVIAHGAANDSSETARDGIGGGILNDGGNVTLIDVMIRSGRADRSGGAIYNRGGSLNLVRTTISDNTVNDNGSGLLNEKGQVLIANSTFSGNFAGKNGGGLFNFEGAVTIINSTFYNNIAGFNGAGILNNAEGTVALKNSIIANAPSGTNPITGNCGGTITDGNRNLQFPDDSCGKTIQVADPQLGTLADNGGFVLTHAIKEGSPAINKADNAVCLTDPISKVDERNIARPFGTACDIGAFEFDPKQPANGFGEITTAGGGDCQCSNQIRPTPTFRRRTPTPTPNTCKPTQPGLPCNCNGFCDQGESYYTCPQDCPFAPIPEGGKCKQQGQGCTRGSNECCSGLACRPQPGTNFFTCQ
jgi:hypothetical protein